MLYNTVVGYRSEKPSDHATGEKRDSNILESASVPLHNTTFDVYYSRPHSQSLRVLCDQNDTRFSLDLYIVA